jgi:hypothetical protein
MVLWQAQTSCQNTRKMRNVQRKCLGNTSTKTRSMEQQRQWTVENITKNASTSVSHAQNTVEVSSGGDTAIATTGIHIVIFFSFWPISNHLILKWMVDLLFHAECVVLVAIHVERGQGGSGVVEWCNTTQYVSIRMWVFLILVMFAQFDDLLFHAVVPSLDLIWCVFEIDYARGVYGTGRALFIC